MRVMLLILATTLTVAEPIRAQSRDTVPPSITLPAELARVLTDYENAWPRGGAAVAELFVEDGYALSPGVPPMHGRAAIAKHYGTSNGPLALRAFAYAREGNVAYILGSYATKRGDPDIGKFTLTLRRRGDGKWMILSDMDNGNTRPTRPPSL